MHPQHFNSNMWSGNNNSFCQSARWWFEYSCSDCHGMMYCSGCNDTCHVNNPIRQGHPYIQLYRNNIGTVPESTHIEHDSGIQLSPSSQSVPKSHFDISGFDEDFLDSLVNGSSQDLEEKCRRATLAEYFHCTSFRPYQIALISICKGVIL